MELTEEQKEALFKNCKSGVESAFLEDMLVIDENRLIVQRLKKRIEEFSSYKDGKGICIKLDADKNYEVVDISEHILLELQKILGEKE